MNILVIGATRGIGRQVVLQALTAGNQVTAMARRLVSLPEGKRLRPVQGDILDEAAVQTAVAGQDAVVLTVACGPGLTPVSLFSNGTAHVLRAMRHHGVDKLVCVTGIGAGDSRGHGGFFYDRIILPVLLRGMYADKERQERLVRDSGCDWVIVRPGFLTNGPLTKTYSVYTHLAGVRAGRISRADVAHFILGQLEHMHHRHTTPLVTG